MLFHIAYTRKPFQRYGRPYSVQVGKYIRTRVQVKRKERKKKGKMNLKSIHVWKRLAIALYKVQSIFNKPVLTQTDFMSECFVAHFACKWSLSIV